VGAGCPSPTPDGEGAGAAGVGAGLTGAEGDCGDGVGTVWAKAPAQSDEIKNEVNCGMQYIEAVLIPSSFDPAVWDIPGASDYTPRRGRNEIVSEPNMLLDLSKRFEMRSAIVALGLVLCSIPPCLAMPVAPLPTLRPSIQVHGCHHQYAHDLTGWHRHDNNCVPPR
jgi:hypothetical protein